jgi:hypothetical protein
LRRSAGRHHGRDERGEQRAAADEGAVWPCGPPTLRRVWSCTRACRGVVHTRCSAWPSRSRRCRFPNGQGHRPSHYVKTLNRSRSICNGLLTPVTFVTVVVWRPLPISAPGRPRGWPPQHPLPMWTSGNGLLEYSLHKFFVTDVKRARYKC